MKLKRIRDKSNSATTPRWVWKLVWYDPVKRSERSKRIGYYCRAQDRWRPSGRRLVRLSEKEAESARQSKIKSVQKADQGTAIPASAPTVVAWESYCRRTGQPSGLAFERFVGLVESPAWVRFETVCRSFELDPGHTLSEVLNDWSDRRESNAPAVWEDLTKWFKDEGSPNAGHRTWLESKRTFDLFIEMCPELASRWQHVDRDDALRFHNLLAGKFNSPATIKKHLANMRKLWRACRRTWVKGNPWSELEFPKVGADPDAWHYFPPGEVRQLLDRAEGGWKGRIRPAWKCGLRPGEIDHLRDADIDWQESRLRIRRHRPDDVTLEWTPKDKDARSIPVDPETLLELRKQKLSAPPGCPYLFLGVKRWRKALASQKTGKWRPDQELVHGKKAAWDAIVAAAGIEPEDGAAIFYALRKTCCCDLLTSGVPAHEVRELMGHADIETTLTWYTKVNKADAEKRIREAQKHRAC